ncbi:MAG: hypothetical protein HDR84_06840 [Bacteroides sp.]|nr:hypothetical protein [Bacteroides sp.]
MKEEEKIIGRYGRKGPWKVPEGYFESLSVDIIEKLPAHPEKQQPVKLSAWQRVKPYVYLAAMFAGIWCMMQMFHNVSGMGSLNIDNPPEHIASLMSESAMDDMYLMPLSDSDYELIDEMSSKYSSIEEFEKDFGVTIEPQFDNADK